jgi:hypothetical protein
MAKQNKKSVAPKSATLTQEEFQKLSPEEQFALVNKANEAAAEAKKEASDAKSKLKASGKKGEPMPSFEVDEDKKNDVEGGTYEFTCRSFTHGGKVHDAAKVVAASESDDEKEALAAQAIISSLVAKKSGIIKRKED